MTEPYLIAHKVRGEPAFDVAIKQECSICEGRSAQKHIDGPMFCAECDDTGYWWIIPTSGHRAYPIEWATLQHTHSDPSYYLDKPEWINLPEHYITAAAPTPSRPSGLAALLAKTKPKAMPITPISRRGF